MNMTGPSRHQMERILEDAELLFDAGAIDAALDAMAKRIRQDLKDREVLVLCVMHGGLMTTAGILPRLGFPVVQDYIHVSRYRGRTSGGELDWKCPPPEDLSGRVVLVVDDILDEGHTLAAIVARCARQGADLVKTAVLLDKRVAGRKRPIEADYVGLEVGDRYVFGFGMDYAEGLRNLPEIYALGDS